MRKEQKDEAISIMDGYIESQTKPKLVLHSKSETQKIREVSPNVENEAMDEQTSARSPCILNAQSLKMQPDVIIVEDSPKTKAKGMNLNNFDLIFVSSSFTKATPIFEEIPRKTKIANFS